MEDFQIKEFGERLKNLSKEKFTSIGNLADLIGEGNLSNYTSGTREPRATFLNKLAQKDVNINWLLTGFGEMLLEDQNKQANERIAELEKEVQELQAENYQLLKKVKGESSTIKNIKNKNNDVAFGNVQGNVRFKKK